MSEIGSGAKSQVSAAGSENWQIRANMNRHMAEFVPVKQVRVPPKAHRPFTAHSVQDGVNQFDDDRSEFSCMTAAQSQFAPSVAFGAMAPNPFKEVPRGIPSGSTSTFSAVSGPQNQRSAVDDSQISVLTPQPAEIVAMDVDSRTKQALHEKKRKLEEFRVKTAQSAKQHLKEHRAKEKEEADKKQLTARERLLKTREFANQQRKAVAQASAQKKAAEKMQNQEESKDRPDVFKGGKDRVRFDSNTRLNEVPKTIPEDDLESEVSAQNHQEKEETEILEERNKVITMFKRIDQPVLS